MKIRQLPESLANKIAAGEVVERPASVVKELIENSLDAQSTWIKVDIEEAGLKSIKVSDNGEGMSERDVKQSFLRHATSKIQYDTDLFHVKSLGFRGEALASISAVSKLTIKTSTGEEAGTKLYLEGGNIIEASKSDARQGTEITVEQLFYNTPARLKYMRTIYTELGHITDLINRYALAHPHVRFEITHNKKVIFKSPGTNQLLQVIANIYGNNVAKKMIEVNEESKDFKITGYIGKPEVTRSSRNFITIIINGRYIKNQGLTQAILRAYHTLLPIHRSPIVVLSIEMDPILVDVNVHPTKLEVRFSKEKELIALIETMIKESFQKLTLIPNIAENQSKESSKEKQKSLQLDAETFQQKAISHFEPVESDNIFTNDYIESETKEDELINEHFDNQVDDSPREEAQDLEYKKDNNQRIPPLYPIGQLQGTYILAQNELGFYMIDQHAAQERIKYEFFRDKLAETDNELQTLLIPITFEFTNDEMMFIKENEHLLNDVGLFFEPFGHQTIAIREVPTWFPTGIEEDIVRDMIEQIIVDNVINIKTIREEVAIMMSCKRSIKANHYLDSTEMNRLLNDLRQCEDPFTCPHGRPVIVHFSTYDIEKMFKRIM